MLDKLPPAEAYEKAVFPTIEEQDVNKTVIQAGWDSTVGANVK
jgi:putative spermidine/putrescine transport system substrate-binding protein